MFNIFRKKFTNGILPDNRTDEQKALDYKQEELVAAIAPVEWTKKTSFRSFPVRRQNGSGSCFPGSTLITMEDGSKKKIKDIKIGDVVLTHKGNKEKVIEVFSRKWQGTTTSIKPRGSEIEIEATNEHPIYAIKIKKGEDKFTATPNFYPISELKSGDFVSYPVDKTIKDMTIRKYESDPDFLWALGLYLAEGSIDEYGVVFSLHQKETYFYERLKKTFAKYGYNVTFSNKTQDLGMQVKLNGKYWTDIFLELGSKLCEYKEINKRLMLLEPSLQMNIVEGVFDGDGTRTKSRNYSRRVLVLTSKKLIYQIQTILLRNNIYGFIGKRKDIVGRKPCWSIEYSKTSRYSFVKDGLMFVQIYKTKKLTSFAGGHVYNIEVEKDNSYVAYGIGVHNCWAQSTEKERGIMAQQKYGEFPVTSASFTYQKRANPAISGSTKADRINYANMGSVLDIIMPSQSMTDEQMNNAYRPAYADDMAKVLGTKNVDLAIDIDTVASTIQATGKGVNVCFRFGSGEWFYNKEVKLLGTDIPWGHSVVAVDYTLNDNNEKCLVIEDSACEDGFPQKLVPESFFKARCFYAGYLVNFKTYVELPEKPKFDGSIKSLQDVLKYEGLFPANQDSTGFFGPITKKGLIMFQIKYDISPALGNLGPITISKLNELYG
jgi:hypothetical protein